MDWTGFNIFFSVFECDNTSQQVAQYFPIISPTDKHLLQYNVGITFQKLDLYKSLDTYANQIIWNTKGCLRIIIPSIGSQFQIMFVIGIRNNNSTPEIQSKAQKK